MPSKTWTVLVLGLAVLPAHAQTAPAPAATAAKNLPVVVGGVVPGPVVFSLDCTFSAIAGVPLVVFVGNHPLAVAASIVFAIGALRALDLHMPPVPAVGLLRLILPEAQRRTAPLRFPWLSESFCRWTYFSSGARQP